MIIRVDQEEAKKFEGWLNERLGRKVRTGLLRKKSSWSERFEYLVNRAIDSERKSDKLKSELNREKERIDSIESDNVILRERCKKLKLAVGSLKARLRKVEDDRDDEFFV